ncbi:MAG: hypothetical protein IPL61_33705 [Myxococcales bacterium]|nr:hypothetical protein [Myxococcales bacterium]
MSLHARALVGLVLGACAARVNSPPAPAVASPPGPVAVAVAPPHHLGCDGARLPGAVDLARDRPGGGPVGARTVVIDGVTTEVWYPARPGSDVGVAPVRYDLRAHMPPAEAAKIPDADNAWLPCACARDLPVDDDLGPLPVVVFLHGAASFRGQSATLVTHWASRGYVVLAPDLPGVGLRAALGGEPTGFPLGVPGALVAIAAAAPADGADDPLGFVRARLAPRVALAGHSLGALLMGAAADQPAVVALVSLAGAGGLAPERPLLVVAGDRDGVVPYAAKRDLAAEAPDPARRFVGLRGAGHLAFSDLCAVGADRGGALAIAAAHGVVVPELLTRLGRDGCGGDAAPIAETNPRLLAATTAFLDERLQCADAAATWRALAADDAVELIPGAP